MAIHKSLVTLVRAAFNEIARAWGQKLDGSEFKSK